MPNRFIVLSGCSGGGKSTLLDALRLQGHETVEEPGRRIVRAEQAKGGGALPWTDMAAFARRAVEFALADREAMADRQGLVFFDRGLIDAASALEAATGEPVLQALAARHRYHPRVFLAPPWPEIYAADPERRHGFADAVAEYERLRRAYPAAGYETLVLPKAPVEARVAFVLGNLD